jgi:hypothetical protein
MLESPPVMVGFIFGVILPPDGRERPLRSTYSPQLSSPHAHPCCRADHKSDPQHRPRLLVGEIVHFLSALGASILHRPCPLGPALLCSQNIGLDLIGKRIQLCAQLIVDSCASGIRIFHTKKIPFPAKAKMRRRTEIKLRPEITGFTPLSCRRSGRNVLPSGGY